MHVEWQANNQYGVFSLSIVPPGLPEQSLYCYGHKFTCSLILQVGCTEIAPVDDAVLDEILGVLRTDKSDAWFLASAWWNCQPDQVTDAIDASLTSAGYVMTPSYGDGVQYVSTSALLQHGHEAAAVSGQQSSSGPSGADQSNAQTAANGFRPHTPDSQPEHLPLTATKLHSGSDEHANYCKDCKSVPYAKLSGEDSDAQDEQNSCTFNPPNRGACSLKVTLKRKHSTEGSGCMTLICQVRRCPNMLCITILQASGWSESATSEKHIVESVHISFEAEAEERPIALATYLHQQQEPRRPQARTVKGAPAACRVEHEHHHWDVEGTTRMKAGGGPQAVDVDAGELNAQRVRDDDRLANAEEELVLTRLIKNSDAFPHATTFQLRRYTDRCVKNKENLDEMSNLTFNGASDDPILLKGEVSADDHLIVLYCTAKLNVAVIKRSTGDMLRGKSKLRDWEHFITKGHISRHAVFMQHRVAKISVEDT